MRLVISQEAEHDFERIADFIAQDNPRRSVSFVRELVASCMKLLDMPQRFQLLDDKHKSGIRRMPYRNYLIFYRVSESRIMILRILNSSQDYEPIIFPAEDEF